MKKLSLICICVFVSSFCYSAEITTYYFIRHAEKVRIDNTDNDPKLNHNGLIRADNWRDIFSNVPFDAVYSTDFKRTQLTAKPTADSKHLPILLYHPNDLYSASFQQETQGKTTLVVGHSNTTNLFVNKILGIRKYPQINDSNNSNLYIVTIIAGEISSILLTIQ
ncbi:MAG TPA: phosphoglycerate mutase [Porticoccaceae bacterium]|nr:phosphoglycerate mutase [Porticoccaceae bacterium]